MKGIDWDNAGLGTKPDGVLAKEFGVHRETVAQARKRRGIPLFRARQPIDWSNVPLGEKPDQVLTQELRIHFNRVGKIRRKLGIPMFQDPDAIDWDKVPLGTKPDTIIAHDLKVPRERVKYQRNLRNTPAFIGIVLTQEGKPCRSVYEAMYDAYLHWKQIIHEHEVKIDGLPYIADFKTEQQYIEIAGMLHYPKYKEKYVLKKRAYQESGIAVTWLYIEDVERLYADCPISLYFREQRECSNCGKGTHDLVKGFCRKCYMRHWHRQEAYQSTCATCGKVFYYHDNDNPKYCSHPCYSKSLEAIDWPSWEWIDEQLQHMSVRQLALQIGVNPNALYQRMYRRKAREKANK